MNIKIISIELKGTDLYITQEGLDVCLIIIPLDALLNRCQVYGLANGEQALEAILREHAQRIHKLPPTDEGPSDKAKQMGGLRSDMTIDGTGATISDAARNAIWRR